MGLLDWLTDGSLGNFGGMSGETGAPPPMTGVPQPQQPMPPVQQTGSDDSTLNPPQPNPGAMAPPVDPMTQALGGGAGAGPGDTMPASPPNPPIDPSTQPIGGGADGPAPSVPIPQPRPPGADATPPVGAAPGQAGTTPSVPLSLAPTNPGPSAAPATPYRFGDQTDFGRALGIDPRSAGFRELTGGIGAGLTAAGNSKGKSPFQALASGAGATLEGSNKEAHATEKDMNAYLTQAIAAQKNGDTHMAAVATANYQMAKLKNEQDKAATDKATPNKNDSPTQLYLSTNRNVAADPIVKGALSAYQAAIKDGDPTKLAAAKQTYEDTVNTTRTAQLAGVGLHPQTAAQLATQVGMSEKNPINAGQLGITKDNITSKLQPGQYYTNPTDGQVYMFTGGEKPSSRKSSDTPSAPARDDAIPKKKSDDDDEED